MSKRDQLLIHTPDEVDTKLRERVSEILRSCAKRRPRPEIAKRMGVSLALLNAWCSTAPARRDKKSGGTVYGRKARLAAALVPLFCDATGDDDLRMFFLSAHQKHLLKLGEQAEQLVSAASRKKKNK